MITMRRPLLILLGAVAIAFAVFGGGYLLADRLSVLHVARATDNLEWLRMEFHLSDAEMARIRQLHQGYLPICQGYCDRIATAKGELMRVLGPGTNVNAQVEQKLVQIGTLRAQCQAAMLRYFAQVSGAMPAEEGRRYLAEMHRLTMNYHEQIEASMAPPGPAAHGHR